MNLTPIMLEADLLRPCAGVVVVDEDGPALRGRPCEVARGLRFCDELSEEDW